MNVEKDFEKITSDPTLNFDQKVNKILDLGLDIFGLGIGLLSKVDGDVYTVINAISPGDMIEPGTTFPLGETYCSHTLKANEAMGICHAGKSSISSHPCYIHLYQSV